MTTRHASCSCGQLRLTCTGEPARVSICHCLDCQKRTGSVFAAQARFGATQVTMEGRSNSWSRRGDEGGRATFHFCPECASTVYWVPDAAPDAVYVATGAFADPAFPAPRVSVYEERRHPWTVDLAALPMEHYA
jgi:hypothetical protein